MYSEIDILIICTLEPGFLFVVGTVIFPDDVEPFGPKRFTSILSEGTSVVSTDFTDIKNFGICIIVRHIYVFSQKLFTTNIQ